MQIRQPSFSKNFELVTPLARGDLARYTQANSLPGTPWEGPSIFDETLGPIDAVSLIQSTFKLEPPGIGNLELIAQGAGTALSLLVRIAWSGSGSRWCWMSVRKEEDVFFEDLSGQILQDDELARLLTFPNVLITAHQAFLTYEAMAEIARGWRRSNSRSSQ